MAPLPSPASPFPVPLVLALPRHPLLFSLLQMSFMITPLGHPLVLKVSSNWAVEMLWKMRVSWVFTSGRLTGNFDLSDIGVFQIFLLTNILEWDLKFSLAGKTEIWRESWEGGSHLYPGLIHNRLRWAPRYTSFHDSLWCAARGRHTILGPQTPLPTYDSISIWPSKKLKTGGVPRKQDH